MPLLSIAVCAGYTLIVQLLLKRGAKVDVKDTFGKTPLIHAIENSIKELAKLLLNHGANVDVQDSLFEQTPLVHAISFSSKELVLLLLTFKADIELKCDGKTPLIHAIKTSSKDMVLLLLKRGADANECEEHDSTPLMYASNSPDIFKVLIDHGADPRKRGTLNSLLELENSLVVHLEAIMV